MKDWFKGLEQREQNLVLMLAGVLCIAFTYFAIYQPLSDKLTRAQSGLEREQRLLAWVESNGAKLAALRASSGGSVNVGNQSLEQIINGSARRYQLTLNRLQPQSQKLQVTLDNAPFTQLLAWIQELQLSNGVTIEVAEFRPQSAPGFVKTRLIVSK